MVGSGDISRSLANGFLFVTNILNVVQIDKLIVPELVQIGDTALLDCQYNVSDELFKVQWRFNRSEHPVYEWSPGSEPVVNGILDGRLDLAYRASPLKTEERRALRIIKLDPDLSGEYTCSVINGIVEAHQTKTMLVYSPEQEFLLTTHHHHHKDLIVIKCVARGIYPQPDIILEHNHVPISKQEQRVSRVGSVYDAECIAHLPAPVFGATTNRITCRLKLPQAGYTAIKEEYVRLGIKDDKNNTVSKTVRDKSTCSSKDTCGNATSKATLNNFFGLLSLSIISNFWLHTQ